MYENESLVPTREDLETVQEQGDDIEVNDKAKLQAAWYDLEMVLMWSSGSIIGPVEIAKVQEYAQRVQAVIQDVINK